MCENDSRSYIRSGGRGKSALSAKETAVGRADCVPSAASFNAARVFPSSTPGIINAQVVSKRYEGENGSDVASLQNEESGSSDRNSNEHSQRTDLILKKYTLSYQDKFDNARSTQDIGRTQEFLISAMSDDASCCLVCLESIARAEAIWNCSFCYCHIHLVCIQEWIQKGAYKYKLPSLSEEHFPNRKSPWCCPKCRSEYSSEEAPRQYKCFCGARVDPVDDPWLVPHACDSTCSRALKPNCGHVCLLPCHPGPCPPCPKSVAVTCHCGKQPPAQRRCGTKSWSCGKMCGAVLACGQHTCELTCHLGECAPCPRESLQWCLCRKRKQSRPCADALWSCQTTCGEDLSCGNHICQKLCHPPGSCGPCPKASLVRTCPCGKSSINGLVCTEDVPCCGDTCGRKLECGVHYCSEKCHYGPCSQCLQISVKRCRCGTKQKELPCSKQLTCDTRCQNNKSCGRHQCKRRCCDGTSCPPCEQACGRKLNCGNHKCTSPCHDGPCYPCPEFVTKACACAGTTISVPCIRCKVAVAPRCRLNCRRPPVCHHTEAPPHACHFGDCPPCSLVCDKILEGCAHRCPVRCHDAVQVKIREQTRAAIGPWEPKPATHVESVCKPCPPCAFPISVPCFGDHERMDLPCSNCKTYSCKRTCNRKLPCGNHACTLECHTVVQAASREVAGTNCQSCEEPCQQPRPLGCTHSCRRPCHAGICAPCPMPIRTICHCGSTTLYITCSEWTNKEIDKDTLRRCPGLCPKELACGHACSLVCHAGPCNTRCSKKITLYCPCKRYREGYPCYKLKAENISVACTDSCRSMKFAASGEAEEPPESNTEQVNDKLLPGRRQRHRKQRPLNGHETSLTVPWRQIGKIAFIGSCVLSVLMAMYFAIISEN